MVITYICQPRTAQAHLELLEVHTSLSLMNESTKNGPNNGCYAAHRLKQQQTIKHCKRNTVGCEVLAAALAAYAICAACM
jgi:hypothetical protein